MQERCCAALPSSPSIAHDPTARRQDDLTEKGRVTASLPLGNDGKGVRSIFLSQRRKGAKALLRSASKNFRTLELPKFRTPFPVFTLYNRNRIMGYCSRHQEFW